MTSNTNQSTIIYSILPYALCAFLIWSPFLIDAQVSLNTPEAMNGYFLHSPNTNGTYLLDNCGNTINHWSTPRPEYHAKLLPNGNLLYLTESRVELRSWSDDSIYQVFPSNLDIRLVYEVIQLPSGNFLCIARRNASAQELQAAGFTDNFSNGSVYDVIVELDSTGNTVWEWSILDHLIQAKDAAAPNFGNLEQNPQKINLNAILSFDWRIPSESFMINGFDYNEELDQILLSVRKLGEVMIIDHGTTTMEAKGSTGGRYGKGGDILYRWGNSKNYNQGNHSDQKLYFQHNPNWIKYGSHKNKIIIFNNGIYRPDAEYSIVEIIDPPVDSLGNYSKAVNEPFLPTMADWQYLEASSFYSGYTSGAKVLPNGNIFITEGGDGRVFEINLDQDILFDSHGISSGFFLFRAEKYSVDYPAFENRDMSIKGSIFPNTHCSIYSAVNQALIRSKTSFSIEQKNNQLTINNNQKGVPTSFSIFDVAGKVILNNKFINTTSIQSANLSSGIYVLLVQTEKEYNIFKFVLHE